MIKRKKKKKKREGGVAHRPELGKDTAVAMDSGQSSPAQMDRELQCTIFDSV